MRSRTVYGGMRLLCSFPRGNLFSSIKRTRCLNCGACKKIAPEKFAIKYSESQVRPGGNLYIVHFYIWIMVICLRMLPKIIKNI